MKLSIIVPALNEEDCIRFALARALKTEPLEVIVVDGGSIDSTTEIARRLGCRITRAPRGRALQMNAGAKKAKGDILVFLHADTLLPRDAAEVIEEALDDPRVVGGRFDVRLDSKDWRYRILAWLINWRSRLSRISTGDQAIFVRRKVFETLGGFPEIPLMEDVAFSKRLKRAGRVACLRKFVTTSARRWQRYGLVKTILLMWWLRFLYFSGVRPACLKRLYLDAR